MASKRRSSSGIPTASGSVFPPGWPLASYVPASLEARMGSELKPPSFSSVNADF